MLSIKENDYVEITVDTKSIVISPIKKRHMALTEYFASYKGDTKQEEFWTDHPIGQEIV